MVRTQVSIDEKLFEQAQQIARRQGVSVDELFRRGLATVVAAEPSDRVVPAETVATRTRQLVDSGMIAWSGRKLPLAPPRVAGREDGPMVADLLLEDRDGRQGT